MYVLTCHGHQSGDDGEPRFNSVQGLLRIRSKSRSTVLVYASSLSGARVYQFVEQCRAESRACYTACTRGCRWMQLRSPLTGPPGECGPGSHRARASACRYIDHSSNDLLILSLRAAHLLLFQLTGTFPVVDLVLIESRVNSGASRVSYVFVPHEGLGGIAI